MDWLNAQLDELRDSIENVNPNLLYYQPEEDDWHITQIIEHLCIVESRICALIMSDKGGQEDADRYMSTQEIERVNADYTKRYRAPRFSIPVGTLPSAADGIVKLGEIRKPLIKALESGTINWSIQSPPHPLLGHMTKKDWIDFLKTHMERHHYQIRKRIQQYQMR